MREEDKSKQELIQELEASRNYIAQLEARLNAQTIDDSQASSVDPSSNLTRLIANESPEQNLSKILIDTLPDLISIKDTKGRFLFANIAMVAHLGISSRNDIIGKTDFDFYPYEQANSFHLDEQSIIETGEALINKEEINDQQHQSEPKYVLTSKIPYRNKQGEIIGVVSLVRDITKRKQTEQALAARENYLTTLNNTLADAIFTVDMPERQIAYVNTALEIIFGYTPDEIIGQQTRIFYADDDSFLRFGNKLRDALTQGKSQLITEHILVRKNGEQFWASIATTFLYSDGKLTQVISIIRDISENKILQQALQESEQRLANILDFSLNAIIAIDSHHKIITYNKGAEYIFGYSADEILGEKLDLLLPARYIAHHRQHIDNFKASPDGARRMNVRGEIYGRRHDGSEFPAEASISKFVQNDKQFFTVMLQDISERKRLETEANIYHAAVEASTDLILVVDREYQYLAVNDMYQFYHDLKREYIIGQKIEDIVGSEFFHAVLKEHFDRCIKGEIRKFETQFNFANMGLRDVYTNYSPLTDELGDIKGVVVVVRDVTEQKRAEKQSFAYELEQEKVKILASFIQDASHEFRTPLAVIKSSLYLMNRIDDPNRQQEKSLQIEEQIERMARLVEQLIMMSRVDSQSKTSYTEINVNKLIQDIFIEPEVAKSVHNKAHTIEQFMSQLPLFWGNYAFLKEALREVIDNAIRFTPDEGLITISASHVDEHIVIEVQDTGLGILEKDMPHIFQRFYRADTAHTTSGFGLGLPIAKAIIEQHQGEIRLQSKSGNERGIIVTIHLPIRETLE